MNPPLVTVIVPNYNHAKYLPGRLKSILDQNFTDFEVIILDDFSTDNSREIIESFRGNEKISHIVYNEKNSGSPFHQWNKGIHLATGSLIWIAESDDHCENSFLRQTVDKFNTYPSIGIAYVNSMEVDEMTGERVVSFGNSEKFRDVFENSYFSNGRKEIEEKLVYENTIPNASGVLFKKSVYKNVGGADETMKLCGDWFLWVKILSVSDVYYISEPLNIFRLTNISVRNRFSKVQTFHERIRILEWMRVNGVKDVVAKERLLFKSLFNSYRIKDLNEPVKMILAEPISGSKFLKLVPAFLLSVVDRFTGKVSRIQTKLVSR